jgi:hypothetical protein
MQLQQSTPAQWESVIADLSVKCQHATQQLETLRAEKRSLVLDALLGNEEARRRLTKINVDTHRLGLDAE